MPALEDYSIFDFSRDDEDDGAVADMNNLDTTIQVSPNPTTRIHKDHPLDQVNGDLQSATLTRKMLNNLEEHGFVSTIQQRTNHKDLQNCLFAWFLSQEEPKKVIHALKDPRWIEAMYEELLQFKLQEVWTLVDLPNGKRAIGSKWIFRNKKDERGIVIRNKARLVAQGYTKEERIDYDEVFAPVARIEAIRLFLAYALFKDFVVYQMDVKSAFLYGKIKKEVYVCQPTKFEDPDFPDRVYKVEKALYGVHQALRAWYKTLSTYLLDNGFQRWKTDKTLFIKRHKGDILLIQVYVDDIIFSSTKKELLDEVVYKELDDSLVRAATTASSLEAKQDSVLDLEKTKTTQAKEIVSLKRRVKKLEQKKRSRTHGLKRINAIDVDEDITIVNDQDDADMFDVNTLTALAALKSVKPKVSAATTITTATISTPRKGIIITELEPEKPLKKKDQISFDKQDAIILQDKFDEEERLTKEKDEANVALTEE
ncbi:putative ribonuclease H-like domain-containing protein [Tanacetum coccineum]